MQNLMQIHCSTGLVILNATTTQYTCSLNSNYHPHWLVQWSHHCSCMHIPVHSPWLPGYINVVQTILVILTMAGLFPDRPHIKVVKKPDRESSHHKMQWGLREVLEVAANALRWYSYCNIKMYQINMLYTLYLHHMLNIPQFLKKT